MDQDDGERDVSLRVVRIEGDRLLEQRDDLQGPAGRGQARQVARVLDREREEIARVSQRG